MQPPTRHTVLWAGGLKTATGFALTLTLLLLVNLFVYQKMHQFTVTCLEPAQANELLRILVVTDLFAVLVLSGLVLLLNRQLTLRDAAERDGRRARQEQEAQQRERLDDLTRLNQTLQTELSERGHIDRQLLQFQKLESLGKLVGGISHEFNNYLTVILGFSEQLLMQMPPGLPEHTTVLEIYKAGERSAELTRALLGLVRTGESAPRTIDVNRQLDAMRRMLQVVVGKRVRLEMVLEGGLPLVTAIPGQIEQVLLNLAANARDAMPENGRLSIETQGVSLTAPTAGMPPGRYAMLSVTDTGCGMNDETRRRMFEPFYTTKERGTGLGLATVREIVSSAGGAVVADSSPGQGATFRIYWPVAAVDAAERGVRSADRDTVCQIPRGGHDTLHE